MSQSTVAPDRCAIGAARLRQFVASDAHRSMKHCAATKAEHRAFHLSTIDRDVTP